MENFHNSNMEKLPTGFFHIFGLPASYLAGYPISKTVFTGAHEHLVHVLIEARKRAGMTQAQLAEEVGKDQTFVSIIERSQRRVDVLEFYALAMAMGADPVELFHDVARRLPKRVDI